MAPTVFVKKKSDESDCVLIIENLTKELLKMHILCNLLMKYKIVWPDPQDSLVLICYMDIGKYQSMSEINTKLRFAMNQV